MDTKAEKAIETLSKWAEEDSENRAIICIAFEKQSESREGVRVQVQAEQQSMNFGQRQNLVLALTTALSENDKALARLVGLAVATLQNRNFNSAVQK